MALAFECCTQFVPERPVMLLLPGSLPGVHCCYPPYHKVSSLEAQPRSSFSSSLFPRLLFPLALSAVAFLAFKYFFSPGPQHLVLSLVLHTVTASVFTSPLHSRNHKNSIRPRDKAPARRHTVLPNASLLIQLRSHPRPPDCPLESRHIGTSLSSPFTLPRPIISTDRLVTDHFPVPTR